MISAFLSRRTTINKIMRTGVCMAISSLLKNGFQSIGQLIGKKVSILIIKVRSGIHLLNGEELERVKKRP
jgi:hypothetical protein